MINWINKKRNKKGFTLVELVVVVAILGIVAAVAIPRLSGTQEKAKFSADKATLAVLNSAVAVAVAEGRIVDAEDLTVTVAANGDITANITKGTGESAVTEPLLEDGAAFQLEVNRVDGTLKLTWEIEDGVISGSPSMNETEGDDYGKIENPSAGE